MQQVADWLEKLGLGQYAERFAENDISFAVLPDLTDQDLKEIGVSLGHRRQLLRAIAELTRREKDAPKAAVATAPSAAPQDTAERRQVTVMFSDLVGSTALSARMDPEDLREIISAYQRCVAETVQRFGGFVAKYMGDGALVYFGYPQAHEDDAERAVRAGLELVQSVGGLKSGAPLQTRVGIATGLVVIGDLIGSGAAQEQTVVGETPNLAARLQAGAAPSTIAIDTTSRRLLGGLFEYRDLCAIEAKGFANRVQAYEVVRPSMVESRFEALRTATTPLVGRNEELDLLLRRWEQAKGGDGCVVLISGEPGIGKSRIAQTIVERLSGEPHARLRYFCSPHYQDSALYPSIAQLERAAGFRREDTAEQRLAKLEAVLAKGTNDLSEAVPLLADLLSIPTGNRYPPLNLTPQKRKEKTLHAQLTQLEGLAARQPVLMVWEDVHWSDPTTLESLDLLVDRAPRLRVLMILTFRPEFTPPWIGRPDVTMLTLNRLPRRQGAEMITYVTGGKALPKEIADQVIERTDGVPLFIEELTKAVVESGVLADAGDRYTLAGALPPLAIPTTLHASLLARLDRLAPTRDVAQICAALGRSFSHELISAVATMPQPQLDDALARLVGAELIFRRGIPPDAEYTFKHALVHETAYGTLLRSRRQQLHARITAALEREFPETTTTQPALMADHATKAGQIEKAIEYRCKAGQQAIGRSAMAEAEGQLRKGLDLALSLPDGPERQKREFDLQMALAMAQFAMTGWAAPAAGEALGRARQLCARLNQPARLALVLTGQFVYRLNRAELPLAHELSKEILDLGRDEDNTAIKFAGHACSAQSRFLLGDFSGSRADAEEALRLYDPAHPPFWTIDAQSIALIFYFHSLTYLGYLDEARSRRDEALALGRQRHHAATLAFLLVETLGSEAHIQSDASIVLRRAEELEAICAEQGFVYWEACAKWHRSCCLIARSRAEEGLALQIEAEAAFRAAGVLIGKPGGLTLLADALGKANRPMEGLQHLEEAARQVEATSERWAEANMHRARGELLTAVGKLAAAESSFHQAITVARRQSAKLWELRAAMGLTRLWRDQGKRAEARDLLAHVYNWFTEGFDTLDLKEAKALLDELA
jgi:class 3 adenylate cyclase/tetratricopeptide (TPR) repeat protein